eukprot:gene9504-417_t
MLVLGSIKSLKSYILLLPSRLKNERDCFENPEEEELAELNASRAIGFEYAETIRRAEEEKLQLSLAIEDNAAMGKLVSPKSTVKKKKKKRSPIKDNSSENKLVRVDTPGIMDISSILEEPKNGDDEGCT